MNAPVIIPDPKIRVNEPLNIYQLATAFMVVAGGLTLGVISFLVEFCFLSGKMKRKDVKEVCAITYVSYWLLTLDHFSQEGTLVMKDFVPKKNAAMPSVE